MKVSRRTAIIAVLLACTACLGLSVLGLWLGVVRPLKERERRLDLATSFLKAYSDNNCTRAAALTASVGPVYVNGSRVSGDPQEACEQLTIRTLELTDVSDGADYAGMSYVGRAVWFDGVFELNDHGMGVYPCPQIEVSLDTSDGKWVVTGWQGQWSTGFQGRQCDGLISTTIEPICEEVAGVTLELRALNDTSIELTADGLEPEGIFYVFYARTSGAEFRDAIAIYPSGGEWVAAIGGRPTQVEPWSGGRFVYSLTNLPSLASPSVWSIALAHPSPGHSKGVACAQLTTP